MIVFELKWNSLNVIPHSISVDTFWFGFIWTCSEYSCFLPLLSFTQKLTFKISCWLLLALLLPMRQIEEVMIDIPLSCLTRRTGNSHYVKLTQNSSSEWFSAKRFTFRKHSIELSTRPHRQSPNSKLKAALGDENNTREVAHSEVASNQILGGPDG